MIRKRAVCVTYPGLCLGFFVLGVGGVDPKKIFGATQRGEKLFRACRGSGGMLLRKILKSWCSGLAEIAFLDISNLH